LIPKNKKYNIVRICLSCTKGSSTGQDPKNVKIKNTLIKPQYIILLRGYILVGLNLFFIEKGKEIKIIIDINKAITPPSLLGIERRIA